MNKDLYSRILFLFVLCLCLTSWVTPSIALASGLGLALTIGHPFKRHNAKWIKILLQVSVVGLGFGMNFSEVVNAGKSGILFTISSIMITLGLGYLLGRALSVKKKTSFLVSVGTAICGGSAIAAMAPVIDADEQDVAISLGTIFILNAVALFIFPWIGHMMEMTSNQFGLWSAIAIHDTSSVVGAATQYGQEALKIATTVKLTRALWIVPVSLITAIILKKKESRISFPYFILAFIGASVIVSLFPKCGTLYHILVSSARKGLTITLFFIGAGLTKENLKRVGFKPILQGILLWMAISIMSFGVISHIYL